MSLISKLSLIGLINGVVFLGGGYLLFTSFLGRVYESRDCEWANIDHVEMHVKMNIPSIEYAECDYNPVEQTRLVKFQFAIDSESLNNYTEKNKLNQLAKNTQLDFNQYLQPNVLLAEHQLEGALYSKKGESENAKWSALYDNELSSLWVRIDYK